MTDESIIKRMVSSSPSKKQSETDLELLAFVRIFHKLNGIYDDLCHGSVLAHLKMTKMQGRSCNYLFFFFFNDVRITSKIKHTSERIIE